MILSRIAFLATAAAAIGAVTASGTKQNEEFEAASSSPNRELGELLETVKNSVEANIDSLRSSYNFEGDQSAAMAAMAAATSLASKSSAFDGIGLGLDGTASSSDGRILKGATIQSFAPQDSLYNRKCGEDVDVVTDPAILTKAINTMIGTMDFVFADPSIVGSTYDNYFGPAEAVTGRSRYSFVAQNGIKAVKICAKCSDYRRMVKPKYRDTYDDICDGYGADGTVSALALIPINEKGRILKGAFEGMISYRGVQSFTYDAPSSKWPSSGLAGAQPGDRFFSDTDFLASMIVAGSGRVVVMPDGIGFGESASFFKGVYIKELYSAASVPVYLATKKYIETSTNCKSELSDTLAVSGYSEGGSAAVIVGDALSSLGFHVSKVLAGSVAHNVEKFVESSIGKVISDTFPLQFAWAVPIFMSTLSSTVPGVANFGNLDQSLLAQEDRLRIIGFVAASLWITDLRALTIFSFGFTGTGTGEIKSFLNPEVENEIKAGGSICDNENLNELCLAMEENNIAEMVEKAPYPVVLCHSPFDDLISFTAQYPDGQPLSNSEFLITDFGTLAPPAAGVPANNFYGHAATKAPCDLAFAYDVIDSNLPNLPMSGRCKRKAKKGN